MHLTVFRHLSWLSAVMVGVVATATAAVAQEAAANAMFVTVSQPITSDAVARIRNQVNTRIHHVIPEQRVDTIVFDFNPDGKPAVTTDYGPCYDLAKYIGGLQGKRTIAFVHAPTSGHTVLPVLACKEVVMGRNAVLGPILTDGVTKLGPSEATEYQVRFNRDDRWPIVQKMFDPDVRLVKGPSRRDISKVIYADARYPAAVADIAGQPVPVQGVQDGQLARYSASVAREIELAKAQADTRKDLAELYGLPPSIIRDDPLQGRSPVAFQWTLQGDVDGAMRESVGRVMRDVRKKDGNILILVLQCGGTDLDVARGLAEDLVKAQSGDNPLQIIAFIPEAAPDAATVIALGCSEIVMTRSKAEAEGEAREATIGNFERYLRSVRQQAIDAQKKSLRDFAEQRGYPGILIDGMLDPAVEILRVRGQENNRNKTRLLSREEFETLQRTEPGLWDRDKVIKAPGVPFAPNASLALELGLARFTVPTTDVRRVCEIYGVTEAKSPELGWVDQFAEFLRIPAVTIILVMVGFIGLILELKVPGLTVPGIVAALCFILVFWSQSRFSGEMFVLALLLFILGIVLLGIEIFVLPGFGICGISGIVFMLAGLGLVTFDKVPENASDWVNFGVRISTYLLALMGAMVLAFLIARFLPQVPYANRMLLAPPTEQADAAEPLLPGASEAAELLGAIGTTTTPLRPAGVVRFGDKFVDVVSDGSFIPAGSRVQVFAVEGTRIVVKEV